MAIAETRLRVVLVDDATAQLLRMNKAMSSLSSSLLGANTSGYTKQLNTFNNTINDVNKSTTSLLGTLTKVTSIYKTLGTLGNIFNNVFGGTYDYYKEFQSNAVGIAGILSSMTTLNGKTLEWNTSMEYSQDIMKKLRIEALQTSATSQDLIETFRGILGPGLSQGMNIDEILKFTTVGVNAVRSMGLPSNQYLQELRSILQGNIRASSSTLATALGITNEDVKNAKNNAGGVFKFLMERMKGFEQSVPATANTIKGQLAILEEAFKSAGGEVLENFFNSYSRTISQINNVLLTKNKNGLFEVNPEFIDQIKVAGDFLDEKFSAFVNNSKSIFENFGSFLKEIGTIYILPVIMEKTLGFVKSMRDNSIGIKNNLFANKIDLQIESEINQLKKDSLKVQLQAVNVVSQRFSNEKNLNDVVIQTNKILKQIVVDQNYILEYEELLKKAGLENEEILRKKLEYVKGIKQYGATYATDVNSALAKAQREANEALEQGVSNYDNVLRRSELYLDSLSNQCSKIGEFTHGLTTAAFALRMFDDEENGVIRNASEFVIGFDMMVTAVGSLSKALSVAVGWLKTFTKWKVVASLMSLGGAGGGLLIGGASAMVAGGAIAAMKGYSFDDVQKLLFNNPYANDVGKQLDLQTKNGDWSAHDLGYDFDYQDPDYIKGNKNPNDLKSKLLDNGGGGNGSKSAKDKTAETLAGLKELRSAIISTTASTNQGGDAFTKVMADADKQIDTWQKKLTKLQENGVLDESQIKDANKLMNDYWGAMLQKATEAGEKQKLQTMKLEEEQARLTMELGRGSQYEEYKILDEKLQAHKEYLENILENEKLTKERRIELEKEYAQVVKDIRDNDMYDFKSAWKATLEELSKQQINYGESIRNVFSSIESAGASLLTSTENFGARVKNFFSDIAFSIMQEMSKLIMKALITNVLLSAFNGMFGGGLKKTGVSNNGQITDMAKFTNYMDNLGVRKYASGGFADGWSIVGERGPELVNFSQPGRVYTAEQTRNALSGGGQNVNIKIDLRNESGQELQAEQTGSSFDGESYIVGVVLKAMATNKGGMRTMMKGLANA